MRNETKEKEEETNSHKRRRRRRRRKRNEKNATCEGFVCLFVCTPDLTSNVVAVFAG
jgi:hypothetical protein